MNFRRFLTIIFLLAFTTSFVMVIFGEAGLLTAFEKSQKKIQIKASIEQIRLENSTLKARIESLTKNRYDLEYYVRKVANLAAKDEIIFEFTE